MSTAQFNPLIVHPPHARMAFLKALYKDLPQKTVINRHLLLSELSTAVSSHNRVWIMGKGCEYGLFAPGEKTKKLMINAFLSRALAQGTHHIYLWNHANEFVEKHNLRGFYTGAFITEVWHAQIFEMWEADEAMVKEANETLVALLKDLLHLDSLALLKAIKRRYKPFTKNNPVAAFNYRHL